MIKFDFADLAKDIMIVAIIVFVFEKFTISIKISPSVEFGHQAALYVCLSDVYYI